MSSADTRPAPDFYAVKVDSWKMQPNPDQSTCNLQITPSIAKEIKEFLFVNIPD